MHSLSSSFIICINDGMSNSNRTFTSFLPLLYIMLQFFLVFGIHVGGDRDFPNMIVGKPWKNLEPKVYIIFLFLNLRYKFMHTSLTH